MLQMLKSPPKHHYSELKSVVYQLRLQRRLPAAVPIDIFRQFLQHSEAIVQIVQSTVAIMDSTLQLQGAQVFLL